jgi:lipopolysaccharide export system protein LptC
MKSHLPFSFPFILITVLALLMFWMNYIVVSPATAQDDGLFNHPDYIVENLSGIQMNYESEIQHVFSAKKMLHFLDEETTYLEQPYFVSNEPEKPVMQVTAERAELSENGENIHLNENVIVSRGMDGDEDKITMATSYLLLMPDDNIARTNKSVAIEMKNATMNAVGLELNNHTGVLQLLSEVEAVED